MAENSRQQNTETLNPRAAKIVAKRADYSGEKTGSQQTVEERNAATRQALEEKQNKGNSVVTAVEKDSSVNDENEEPAANAQPPVAVDDYAGQEDEGKSEQETAPVLAALNVKKNGDRTETQSSSLATADPKDVQFEVEEALIKPGVEVKEEGGKPMITVSISKDSDVQDLEKVGFAARIVAREFSSQNGKAAEKIADVTGDIGNSLKNTDSGKMLHSGEAFKLDRQSIEFGPEMKRKFEDRVVDPASEEQEQKLTRHASGHNEAKPHAEKSLAELEAALAEEKKKKQPSLQEIIELKKKMEEKGRDMNDERRNGTMY
jgi:hypothetical protein